MSYCAAPRPSTWNNNQNGDHGQDWDLSLSKWITVKNLLVVFARALHVLGHDDTTGKGACIDAGSNILWTHKYGKGGAGKQARNVMLVVTLASSSLIQK